MGESEAVEERHSLVKTAYSLLGDRGHRAWRGLSSPDPTFAARARRLGIAAAWTAFIVVEVYAIVSGLAFASQGRPVESGPYLSIMALLVVVMGPFLVLSMVAVHAYASPGARRTPSRLSPS